MSNRITEKPLITSIDDDDTLITSDGGSGGAVRLVKKSVLLQGVKDDIADVNNGIQATGTFLNLTDTIKGKAQLVDLVHNYWDMGDVSGTRSVNIQLTEPLKTGITYTMSALVTSSDVDSTVSRIQLNNKDNTNFANIYLGRDTRSSTTFTPIDDVYYLNMMAGTGNISNSEGDTFTYADIQLELGNTAHPYVPYEGYEVKSCGNNNFSGVIEQGSCWGGTLDNSAIRISSDYTPIKQGEEYLITYDIADRCFCVFYNTSKVFTTQDSEMTAGRKTFKASADGYVRVILAYNNDRNITPNDGDFNLRVMPVEDTVFITNSTDTAYINTYDGATNIYADTTLTVRYGNTKTVNDVVTNKGDVDKLKYKNVKGEWVTLRDSLNGKCEVKGEYYNLWNKGDVSGTQSKTIYFDEPLKTGTYTISALITSSDTDATTSRITIANDDGTISHNVNLTRGICTSWTFTISDSVTRVIFDASTSYANGANDTFTYADIMLVKGTEPKPYVPYSYSVKSVGENVFDGVVTNNTVINNDGSISANTGVATTDNYIIVGNTINVQGVATVANSYFRVVFYDENKAYISRALQLLTVGTVTSFTPSIPTNAKYMRMSYENTITNIIVSHSGAAYQPYVSSTATLSTNTPTAYLDTYEGLTQVYSEYDVPLGVRYGNSPVTNDILSNKGNIAYLLSQLNA